MRHWLATLGAVALVLISAATASAQGATCTAADFAAAVDASGASLRRYTQEMQPKLQERMRAYRDAMGVTDSDYEGAVLDAIHDKAVDDLDTRSSELIVKIDTLGRVKEASAPDCDKLAEIKSSSAQLVDVIKQKTELIIARLDAKIAAGKSQSAKAAPAEAPAQEAQKEPKAAPPKADAPVQAAKPAEKKPAEIKPPETWATATKPNDAYAPPPPAVVPAPLPEVAITGPADPEAGYSISEIQDATRGFFGTISTGLASVIEQTFKTSGRPAAYVLGTEGGAAFIAGLRYGQGTLYMRNDPQTRKVYWHGPSVGSDLGASGSRTMFLIYKLKEPNALYRSFTGVDGSAFFVGGVGVTLLKGGDVLMAPIRSGLGFRLGANIGYLRFSDQPTWNPF